MNEKYVVFKREDWEAARAAVAAGYEAVEVVHGLELEEVQDAVVIRRQDVFAAPALDAYANSIRVALEADVMMTSEANPRRKALERTADYFHEQAVLAWETDRKVPD